MDPYLPFVAFQAQPWLALAPAVVLGAAGTLTGLRLVLSTGLLWLVYTGYELAVAARLLCSGECNIRIDLLVIAPLLLGLSAASLLALARWAVRRARAGG